MHDAYCKAFDRMGLEYRPVWADSGAIGGNGSQEFHVLAESGEDLIAFSTESDYAANIEKAEALAPAHDRAAPTVELSVIDTPNAKTIDELVEQHGIAIEKTTKTLFVKASDEIDAPIVALLVRGDHELNEIKAENLDWVASPLEMATEEEIRQFVNAGPRLTRSVGLELPFIVDRTVAVMIDFAAGANIDGKHHVGINWDRDVALGRVEDLRNVVEGDPSPCGQGTLMLKRGIEVGHIFQLGTTYSEKMNCGVLDSNGKNVILEMGCYGIGVSRVVASAIEQNNDENGIIWPDAIAPFQVSIVPMNMAKSEEVKEAAEKLYADLTAAGIDVLFDDRKERPGVMFADHELIGIPHTIVIGNRSLENGEMEYKNRRTGTKENVAVTDIVEFVTNKLAN